MKTEIFPQGTEYCCTTLWVKNSLEFALSLTFRRYFRCLFSAKIQDGRQKWRKLKFFPLCIRYCWSFSPLNKTLLYYPVGQKFTRNRSISYGFRDIHTCSFSTKIQDGRQIFPFCIGHSCTTLQVKNSLEITLSCSVFEIFTLFHFPLKSKMAAKSGENWNLSPLHRILLYYPVGQKFAWKHYLLRFLI